MILSLTVTLTTGIVSAADDSSENTLKQSSISYNTFTSSSTSSNTVQSEGTGIVTSEDTLKEIKVLIYNGEYSIGVCVTGIKNGLDTANANNLVPGYHFSYATSTTITSAKLAGYDVLAMPGGSDGSYYVSSSSISGTAIKSFVSNGGGYLGICAGAYSGVKAVSGYYNGWGVAPHVMATRPWVEGNVPILIEAAGEELFGYGGIITMAHYNGPAMYASGGDMVTFATYADNSCYSQGLGAIVGDFYGLGRSVIVGPHPELDPKYPDILANLVVWAANKTSTPEPDPSSSATIAQISNAAATVKSQYEANKVLPNLITVNGNQISMAQFAYLLASATVNLNMGSTATVNIRNVDAATSPSGSIKTGTILKSEYVSVAQNLSAYILTNGRAPNYLSTSLGNMSFENTVYMFSKIMDFYKTNNRLPNYVSMTASSSGTTPTPTPTKVSLSQVISAAATVKSYYESNKILPSSITISSQSVNMSTLLYLLATATIQVNSANTADITLKNVNAATSPSGSIKSGNIYRSEFVTIAQNILSYISGNNRAPDYLGTSLGNLSFDKAVYMYSKIMNFYKSNNRLPNYVSI